MYTGIHMSAFRATYTRTYFFKSLSQTVTSDPEVTSSIIIIRRFRLFLVQRSLEVYTFSLLLYEELF